MTKKYYDSRVNLDNDDYCQVIPRQGLSLTTLQYLKWIREVPFRPSRSLPLNLKKMMSQTCQTFVKDPRVTALYSQ